MTAPLGPPPPPLDTRPPGLPAVVGGEAERTAALAERVAGVPGRALDVYTAGVDGYAERLADEPVDASAHRPAAAAVTLRLAGALIDRARHQATPDGRAVAPPLAEVRDAVLAVVDTAGALGDLVAVLRRHLIDAYPYAGRGDYTAPPGADPLAELRVAAAGVYEVERLLADVVRVADTPARHLGRMT